MRTTTLLAGMIGISGCRSEPKTVETTAAPTANEARVTSSDGTQIAFDSAGRGPALIVVSGALSSRAALRDNDLVPLLASQFTVYTYDRRGRGESTDVQPYAVQREIEDLDALITHARGPVFLYGVSSGAALAMQATAALGPSKVTKLAIYEPPYGQDPAAHAKQKARIAEVVETGKPGDAAELFLTSIGMPPEALAEMKRSPAWDAMAKLDFTLNYDYAILGDGTIPEDVTRAITVPTLVLTGEKTIPFLQPTADQIAKQLADAQRKTLAGQTHQAEARVVVPVLTEFFAPASS